MAVQPPALDDFCNDNIRQATKAGAGLTPEEAEHLVEYSVLVPGCDAKLSGYIDGKTLLADGSVKTSIHSSTRTYLAQTWRGGRPLVPRGMLQN